MQGRFLSSSFLASAAVAVLAHAGAITSLVLLAPAGGAWQPAGEKEFEITLVELAAAEPAPDMAEPNPAAPVPETPQPEPAPVPDILPAPEMAMEPSAQEPALYTQSIPDASSESETDSPPPAAAVEPVTAPTPEEGTGITLAEAAASVPATSAPSSGAPAMSASEGEVDMTAYWHAVQQQLARHAPRGVRGARDCEVEFQLSGNGEVVFVGIRTSSGAPLYDRRCLRAVTNAAPFPAAPQGAAPENLSFAIVMLQKR